MISPNLTRNWSAPSSCWLSLVSVLLHPSHLLHPPLGPVHLGPDQAGPDSQLAHLWTLSLHRYMGRPSLRRCMGAVQLASSLLLRSGQEHGEDGGERMLDG